MMNFGVKLPEMLKNQSRHFRTSSRTLAGDKRRLPDAIVDPDCNILGNLNPIQWTPEMEEAKETLKEALGDDVSWDVCKDGTRIPRLTVEHINLLTTTFEDAHEIGLGEEKAQALYYFVWSCIDLAHQNDVITVKENSAMAISNIYDEYDKDNITYEEAIAQLEETRTEYLNMFHSTIFAENALKLELNMLIEDIHIEIDIIPLPDYSSNNGSEDESSSNVDDDNQSSNVSTWPEDDSDERTDAYLLARETESSKRKWEDDSTEENNAGPSKKRKTEDDTAENVQDVSKDTGEDDSKRIEAGPSKKRKIAEDEEETEGPPAKKRKTTENEDNQQDTRTPIEYVVDQMETEMPNPLDDDLF